MFYRVGISLLLLCIVASGTWSLLASGFYRGHDFVHASRIVEMSAALHDGHIPPRWSANFGYGYGMPLFNFYAPLPYILGAFLYQYVSVITAIKLLIVCATVGTTFGMYKLSRDFTGHMASIVAALAATVAPYRAVNIFVRGALSEAWGIAWIPWLFLASARVVRNRGGFLLLSVVVAGMALSHNLVTLMAIVSSGIWAALLLVGERWYHKRTYPELLRRLATLFTGYSVGFGLSAWYVVPSLIEKNYTQIDQKILTGYFDFRLHFLYIRQLVINNWGYGGSEWGPDDGISFFLGYGQLLALAVFIGYLAWGFSAAMQGKKLKDTQQYYIAFATMITLFVTLALTLSHAQPVWEYVQYLKYLQFPWRWLSVSTVLLALLVGFSIEIFTSKYVRAAFAIFMSCVLLLSATHFRPESLLDDTDSLYYTDPARIRTHMSEILPDYIPIDLAINDLKPATVILESKGGTELQEHIISRTHEHLVRIDQEATGPVEFAIAYFLGWSAEVDGKPSLVEPNEFGLISITIPEGKHVVGLFFSESPIRRVANTISVISAVMLVAFGFQRTTFPKK